jgi:aspartyl-tRNA synthetase
MSAAIMERTLIQDARNKMGEPITLKGFVQAVRDQKAVQFIILRDHTGLIQLVAERSEANKEINETISSLTRESAIEVTGTVLSNPGVKLGQLELQLKTIRVVSPADAILPIDIFGKIETEIDKRPSNRQCESTGFRRDLSKFIHLKSWEAQVREAPNSSRWIISGRPPH